MAVPKKKTSKSRRNQRRSHLALDKQNIITDAHSGDFTLPHRMCLFDMTYKGKPVVKKNIINARLSEMQGE
jgi:large subunit ribosomal protein L32